MVNFIQKTTGAHITPFADGNRVHSVGTGTDTSFNVAPANGGGTETHGFITPAGEPNNDAWESGTYQVEIEVDAADADIDCDVRVARYDAAGNLEEVGSFVGVQDMSTSRTFTPVAPTWGSAGDAQACDDLYVVELLFTNNAAHGSHSVDIGLGTAANEDITPITEDGGGCTAPAGVAQHPQPINISMQFAITFIISIFNLSSWAYLVENLNLTVNSLKLALRSKPCQCQKEKFRKNLKTTIKNKPK